MPCSNMSNKKNAKDDATRREQKRKYLREYYAKTANRYSRAIAGTVMNTANRYLSANASATLNVVSAGVPTITSTT